MLKKFAAVAVLAALALIAGCSAGTHSRGQFQGHVVGKTEEEIINRVGKPHEVVASDPAKPRWVYTNKTFDPDNFNQLDTKATIILERNAEGKLVGRDVLYG
jgi:hypothetical protein